MKTPTSDSSAKGIALVLVLGFLVVISALTIAFFSSVTTVASSSRTYSSGVTTNLLADTAVQMVVSQIRDGTTPTSFKSHPCWTSQPGMIRVFGTATKGGSSFPGDVDASAEPYAYYKLYSSNAMVITGSGARVKDNVSTFDPQEEYSPMGGQPGFALASGGLDPKGRALFTDLNAPILVQDANGPIAPAGSAYKYQAVYPIVDPLAQGYPIGKVPPDTNGVAVEGFWLNNVPRGAAKPSVPPGYRGAALPITAAGFNPFDASSSGGAPGNPAPMPVRWLYVLRDGTVLSPVADATGLAHFTAQPLVPGASGTPKIPTTDNPIVGRVAFWTDDETCKININTASEPTFWDTPQVSSTPESVFAKYQPANGEFQRYPGHPSTVALSPVLGRLFGYKPTGPTNPYILPNGNKETFYKLLPRVNTGGSLEGTLTSSGKISPDGDRLFSSVDELAFAAPGSQGGGPGVRPAPTLQISKSALQRSKFFLTAYNRAPELNLFGQPRVSIWPVSYASGKLPSAITSERTAKDKEFVFCSTVGNSTSPYSTSPGGGQYQFYFTRASNKSATADASILRNSQLYAYLQYLTGGTSGTGVSGAGAIPGFGGGTFLTKYPKPAVGPSATPASDRDQILTEIFDYIRSTNLVDTSVPGFTPYTPQNTATGVDYSGEVVPSKIGNTRGFGRFPTVSEAAIVFTRSDANNMQAILLLEAFCPSYGYTTLKDTYTMEVDFRDPDPTRATNPSLDTPILISTSTVPGTPDISLFPRDSFNCVVADPFHGWCGRNMAGFLGFANQLYGSNDGSVKKLPDPTQSLSPTTINNSRYPFASKPIPVPASGQFTFKGGSFRVKIYGGITGLTAATVPDQTISFTFPPNVPPSTTAMKLNYPTFVKAFKDRIAAAGGANIGGADDPDIFILSQDVVRSVEAKTDLRLIAGQSDVRNFAGFKYFDLTSPGTWGSAATPMAHSLRTSNGKRHNGAVPAGLLAKDTLTLRFDKGGKGPYSAEGDPRTADVPNEVDGVTLTNAAGVAVPGDFDTGLSKFVDGPFINKADEGNSDPNAYYLGSGFSDVGPTFFSPNRIVASPGWFGSLPTGVQRALPYQTLLFRPDGQGRTNHPGINTVDAKTGLRNPYDHLIMDLFYMPVVEPYPISEPFSTAGKINLNYQIMPFGNYIRRETAMRALLRSEKLEFIPKDAKNGAHSESNGNDSMNYRCDIDEATTLSFLEQRWSAGKNPMYPNPADQVFRSASQICEVDLYPKPNLNLGVKSLFASDDDNQKYDAAGLSSFTTIDSAWNKFWDNFRLTGDNVRERPYARLYSRLTTKSNTFTVHMKVQTLLKRPSDPKQDTWDEDRDQVTGEYRGSALIERYLDPADSRFSPGNANQINPDNFAKGAMTNNDILERAYKFRVVATKQFGQ